MSTFALALSYICMWVFFFGSLVLTQSYFLYGSIHSVTPFLWIPGWASLLWFLDCLYVQLPGEQQ